MRTCRYRASSHNIAAPGRCGCGLPGRVENLPGARQCLRRRRAWTRGPRERAHLVSVAEQVPPVATTSCMIASSVHAQAGAVGRSGDDGGRKHCFIGVRRKVESESSSNRSTSPYTLTSPRTAPLRRHRVAFAIDQALGLIWLPRPISSQSPRPEFQNCSWADPLGVGHSAAAMKGICPSQFESL